MPCSSKKRFWPWTICAFLFLATMLSYMDRLTLAMTAPLIQREFGLDNSQLGLLLSAFFYTYGMMQIVVGPLLDRVDVRWGYAVAVCWWSLAGALTGMVRGFEQLFACRLMLGTGEAANWPAAVRITSRLFPPEKRSLANGFFNSGSMAGAIVTPPLVVWISMRWQWRTGFITIGLLALIWATGWFAVTRNLSVRSFENGPLDGEPGPTAPGNSLSGWAAIIRSRQFWGLMVASTFANPCYYFYSNWLPTYFAQQRAISFGMKLGNTMIVPFLGLGIGSLLGGVPVVLMTGRGLTVGAARKRVIAVATVAMLSVISVPWVETMTAALMLIFVITVSMGSWLANYLSFCQDVSYRHVAAVAGVLGSSGAFSGALLIWLAGLVSKLAHGFGPIFIALGIMPVIASLGILVIMSGARAPGSPVAVA